MRSITAIALLTASAWAQGVTQYIAPKANIPAGCVDSRAGTYELSVQPMSKKRSVAAAAYPPREMGKTLQVTLAKGTMKDTLGRTGYIADNYQFQFDGPPQAGSIYTGGWSVCSNGSLALGGSAIFYQCLSGDFYNLYDRWWAEQCRPINIQLHSLSAANDFGASSASLSAAIPTATKSPKAQADLSFSDSIGLSGKSNTMIATGGVPTASASVTLTNTGFVSPKNSSASATSLSSVASALSASASSLSSSSTSAAASKSASASSSSASAKASNAARGVDSKAPTIALLMGVLGMVVV